MISYVTCSRKIVNKFPRNVSAKWRWDQWNTLYNIFNHVARAMDKRKVAFGDFNICTTVYWNCNEGMWKWEIPRVYPLRLERNFWRKEIARISNIVEVIRTIIRMENNYTVVNGVKSKIFETYSTYRCSAPVFEYRGYVLIASAHH